MPEITERALMARPPFAAITLQRRFSECVSQFADRVALRIPATATAAAWQLSYRELDVWSHAIAARLQQQGIKRGTAVAVYMPRSAAAVAALVGIAKLGAIYVPLGLDYPADRIAFTLSDTAAQAVLVSTATAGTARAWQLPLLELEERPQAGSGTPLRSEPGSSDDCAYILYTSGSTGRPKGVEVAQRGILRLVDPSNTYCRFDEFRRFLLLAPLTFDAATLEIWGPLLNGGCCVVYPTEGLPDPVQLAAVLREEHITTLWLTASLFNWLIDNDALLDTTVEEILAGGEVLSPEHVRRAQQQMPNTQFINGYGPTETTTFACCYRIPRPLPNEWQSIPIGFPILRTPVYVLDEQRQPVVDGAEGELFIGGAGVALGYRNLPEQTASRFQSLVIDGQSDRVYATGDRVCRNADGAVEYRGRADDQIKISGYRIELGEINHALNTHPEVKDAVTLAQTTPDGQRQLVAYVAADAAIVTVAALREFLHGSLPPYMIPSQFVVLAKLPINANGKVDRNALKQLPTSTSPLAASNDVRSQLQVLWSAALGRSVIADGDNFFDCGGTSLLYMGMVTRAQKEFGLPLRALDIFEYPVFGALVGRLEQRVGGSARRHAGGQQDQQALRSRQEPIAIVGVSARLPGARNARQYWRNLLDGVESITRFSDADLDPTIPLELRNDPAYVKARGLMPEAEYFDAAFFGISPLEAAIIDPQQRVFLETAWEALEDAGIPPSDSVSIGVFAGTGSNTYFLSNVLPTKGVDAGLGELPRALASEKDYVATRTAFKLGLTGPAVSIHTACSTSLVAVAQAVDSLRAGRCDVAIAGGVSLNTPLNAGYLFQEGSMLSPDGATRSFDAHANGTSFNSGAGAVVLKPLSAAAADGDRIYAVIKGVGLNNDGSGKASFTAPSIRGQVDVIRQAQRDADVDPRTISYIETHGTATPLGDPIEIEALTRAFADAGVSDTGFCAVGSVKSNIGHTVAGAGVAGLIKTAFALHQRQLPPTLYYQAPNPQIDFANSPFFVNAELRDWHSSAGPLRAAVSSFGVGGTNAHVILEQAPPIETAADQRLPELVLLSAKKADRLGQARTDLADFLGQAPDTSWRDVAWTLQRGRARFKERQFIVLDPRERADGQLREPLKTTSKAASSDGTARSVVFMFPGQGSQYVAMGLGLYRRFEVFREVADHCFELLKPLLPRDLRDVLFSEPGADPAAAAAVLKETQYTQPALFVVEYALARLWMSWGVQPAALIGHSIGEFVAATLAGVFSLEDGLRLVAERARLMQARPTGVMLAVQVAADSVRAQLPASCDIAAINGPELCVVAGPHDEIDQLAQRWSEQGIQSKLLHTSHAFHSPMMDEVIEPFARVLQHIELHEPAIPIMSTVDVGWLTPQRALDRGYWARHLRETVRFADGVRELLKGEPALYLEVGPRNTAATLAAQQMRGGVRQPVATSLGATPAPGDIIGEQMAILVAAGELWLNGIELDWAALHAARPHVVSLPAYPFARDRHWLDVAPGAAATIAATALSRPMNYVQPYVTASISDQMPVLEQPPVLDSNPLHISGTPSMDQQTLLLNELRDLFAESSGEDLSQTGLSESFLDLGFDSLFLTQAALSIKKRYKVDIPFRRLLSDLSDFGSLAQLLLQQADASVLPQAGAPAPVATTPQSTAPAAMPQPMAAASMPMATGAPISTAQLAGVQGLIQQQLLLMAQQLQMLGGGSVAMPQIAMPAASVPATAPAAQPIAAANAPAAKPAEAAPAEEKPAAKPFGAQTRIDTSNKDDFTPSQREHYQQLLREYTAHTAKSKAFTVKTRPKLSDPRVVSGFRPAVKEITYPIVVDRSKGCRLWDIDGNEYIDTLCGYGSMFFGYQPQWIIDALDEQLARGMEIGPQHPLTGEVIELLAEFLPHDRYAFCNTGSEAVLGAMRMARTATGRDKIIMFNGDYHGIVDEVIVRGGRNHKSFPAAAGIMPDAVKNMVLLDYGSDEALDYIRDNADDIAGVLVETVQSRHPALVPVEFLHKLRELTKAQEIALIFDEVITGFRVAPGGFQEFVGIQADVCAYGKVIGGGISLGIIAGCNKYMDTLDGGTWQFGDDSTPEVGVTYFAGTFVRHPLALAAAKAVLLHLKQQGPQLQRGVNEKAAQFAADLNLHFKRVNAPIEIEQFCSMMYFKFTEDLPWGELMFCDMRRQGIHAWYGRPMFVSCAHTDDDLAKIRSAFMRSLARMQEWGFIPGSSRDDMGRELAPPVVGAKLGMDAAGNPAWFVEDPAAPNGLRQVSASFE